MLVRQAMYFPDAMENVPRWSREPLLLHLKCFVSERNNHLTRLIDQIALSFSGGEVQGNPSKEAEIQKITQGQKVGEPQGRSLSSAFLRDEEETKAGWFEKQFPQRRPTTMVCNTCWSIPIFDLTGWPREGAQ